MIPVLMTVLSVLSAAAAATATHEFLFYQTFFTFATVSNGHPLGISGITLLHVVSVS